MKTYTCPCCKGNKIVSFSGLDQKTRPCLTCKGTGVVDKETLADYHKKMNEGKNFNLIPLGK